MSLKRSRGKQISTRTNEYYKHISLRMFFVCAALPPPLDLPFEWMYCYCLSIAVAMYRCFDSLRYPHIDVWSYRCVDISATVAECWLLVDGRSSSLRSVLQPVVREKRHRNNAKGQPNVWAHWLGPSWLARIDFVRFVIDLVAFPFPAESIIWVSARGRSSDLFFLA